MSRWIEDPQGREEVEKVTRFLKLPVWKPQYLGKFREFWNELWEKIDTNAETSALTLSGKEDSFPKNTAFNRDFGVAREQVLEGAKLAEILGIPYGGLLNNNTTKKRGLGYYCTVNESIYKCLEDTQLNYAESNYFDAISNDDLLGKLKNLCRQQPIELLKIKIGDLRNNNWNDFIIQNISKFNFLIFIHSDRSILGTEFDNTKVFPISTLNVTNILIEDAMPSNERVVLKKINDTQISIFRYTIDVSDPENLVVIYGV